ncbi:hypothetical protein QTP86_006976 [Hemibagrus guttatus]|nr:hypothetical protein QTP86_006976 [Hemibagrus guttatus]
MHEVAPSPVKMPSESWPQLNGDSDRYCQLCHAWFNNPGMARQHYDGKKHKKNAARADLLEQLGKTLDMGEMKGLKRSYTCDVCNVTLNSVAQYHAHLQGSKHQNNLAEAPRVVHSRAAEPSDVHCRAAGPSDVHRRAAAPSDVHRRALAPSDVHRRALAPSDVHRRALAPSDVHRRALAPSDVHRRALAPSDVHRRTMAPGDDVRLTVVWNAPRGGRVGARCCRNSPLLTTGGAAPPTEASSWGDAPHRNMGGARLCQYLQGKGRELADMMERRKVDILCVQETKWKGSKARSIGAEFKLFYYGVDSRRNGVGVVLKEEFVKNVLEVKRVSDRVMSLKLEIEGVMLNVVSGYAPQVGCELEEKERFWSELDEVMESIPTGERVVIGADFNRHVGEGNRGDEEVEKREEHRVTYKSGGRRTQVDYILCRRGNLKEISDCKVVVGESVARQHRMVVCRMTLMVCKKKRSKIEKKTKWWKLKKEECCEEFRQKLRQALGGQVVLPKDWETTAEVIRETGRKVLGVSSGRRKEDKETWWWNEEVQDSIQRKRLAKKMWDMDRTKENRQEYKELQRRVKREVSKAKQKAYDELYTRLDTREGQKDLYRLARQRDRDGKDVQQVRVIKDRDGRVLTSEESVQRRWKEYFEELMNEENEREKRVEGVNSVEQKVDKIRKDEVRKALKRMKSGKAVGPDDIPVEV